MIDKEKDMAALEEAFSKEYQEDIDAETAYELYWSGTIKDKTQFQCPYCLASATCANLDVLQQDMTYSPHFRVIKGHNEGCKILEKEKSKNGISKKSEPTGKDGVDIFILNRPASFFKTKEPVTASLYVGVKNNTIRSKNKKRYSIRPLVSNFIQYKIKDTLNDEFIQIGEESVSYRSFFKGVYNQDVLKVPDRNLAWWGPARFYLSKNKKFYQIVFCEKLKYNQEMIHPSIFIDISELDDYPVSRLLKSRIEKIISEKDNRGFCFIYGSPFIKNKDNINYVNFNASNLDMLEVRYLTIFDELKKKH